MDGGQMQQPDNEYRPRASAKLVGIDPQVILEKIAQGALQREVGAEYGVGQDAISWYISKTVPPETWAAVKRQSINARLERAAESMEAADDALMLARARESARLWMWRAEREHPEVWGAKQQVDMRVTTTDLSDRLRAARARTVEGTAKRVDTVANAPQPVDNAVQQSARTENSSQA